MSKFLLLVMFVCCGLGVFAEQIKDEFVDEWFVDKDIPVVEQAANHNYESLKRVKIILSPTETVSTPKKLEEGQKINLVVKRNARIGANLLKKGTPASAVIEQFVPNGMTGVQAVIVLGRIEIEGLESDKLQYYCLKEGQNRTTWIMPIKWALTWIPFAGTFTNLIKGGQAKLSPKDELVVYYYLER